MLSRPVENATISVYVCIPPLKMCASDHCNVFFNKFVCLAKILKCVVIVNYLGPVAPGTGFSYYMYLKSHGCGLQKGHFPHESGN